MQKQDAKRLKKALNGLMDGRYFIEIMEPSNPDDTNRYRILIG